MKIHGVTSSQNTKGFMQPMPPTSVVATNVGTSRAYNDGSASVAFIASASGAPATSFTVTSTPGSYTATGSSSPIIVTGLQSNTSYTFTVSGTNGAGTGIESSASASITATTVPQAPTIGAATATSGTTATVAYTAGATGGAAVSAYTATSSPTSLTGTGSSPITVSGLTQNTSYTFTVTATNANGTSAASSASASITTFKVTLVDNFNRANGSLGSSSDGLSTWSVDRGTFTLDSNQAYSANTSDSMATVALSTSSISNAQIDTPSNGGGVGLAVWVTDANSYWGIYPNYSSITTTNSASATNCSGGGFSGTSGNTCASSVNISGQVGPYILTYECNGWPFAYGPGSYSTHSQCTLRSGYVSYVNQVCPGDYAARCNFDGGSYNYSTNTNASYVTNYYNVTNNVSSSALKIKTANAVVVNNAYSAALSYIASIGVSTSGNVITYTGYSGAAKTGSVLVTSTYDAGAGTKGAKVGVFKTSSDYSQGSYVDNINVTVV